MRVDRAGIRIEEALEHFLALQFVDAVEDVRVALVQRLADLLRLLAGQLQAQPVVPDRLLPQRVQRGAAGRPRCVFAVEFVAVVAAEIETALQQAARVADALADALAVHGEHRPRRIDLAALDRVVEPGRILAERGHVLRGQEHLARVQRLQEALQHFLRQRIVQRARTIGIATVGQQAVDQARGGGLVGGRRGWQRIATTAVGTCQQGQRRGQGKAKGQGEQGTGGLHGDFRGVGPA